jgi:hypothetical protein
MNAERAEKQAEYWTSTSAVLHPFWRRSSTVTPLRISILGPRAIDLQLFTDAGDEIDLARVARLRLGERRGADRGVHLTCRRVRPRQVEMRLRIRRAQPDCTLELQNRPSGLAGHEEHRAEFGAISAEVAGGGVRVNIIPKDGGNRFSGSAFLNFANDKMQGNNVDPTATASRNCPSSVR